MKARPLDSATFALINVRAASLLVPRTGRAAWTAEWTAEIHHLRYASGLGDSPAGDPVRFSLGAFPDAFWLGCNHLRARGLPSLQTGSPARCALLLASLAVVAFLLCLNLPGARNALLPLHSSRSADLVAIFPSPDAGAQSPGIPLEDYLEWRTDTARLFSDLAWYYPTFKNVNIAHQRTAHLSIALASANLFSLLRVPIPASSGPGNAQPILVLTRSAWRTWYRSNPHIAGHTATIDGRPVRVAVLADDAGPLPATMQAWLLEDEADLGKLCPQAHGFAFAHIRSGAFPAPRSGVRFMIETRHSVTDVFDCVSVSWLAWQPTLNFFFALLLACLALPATTALPLGDYPRYRGRMVLSVAARRWAFLALKLLLLIAVVYLATMALAWGPAWQGSTSVFLQVIVAFPALLFGLRWSLQDQRRRCPECLRRLSSPARVGQASCNFLSWNGTELFCVRGHGLLYIPELPTSWFSTQRWLCLDSSWRCLFPDACSPSPGMV